MKKYRAFARAALATILILFLCSPAGLAGTLKKGKKQSPPPPPPTAGVGVRFGPDMLRGYEEVGGGVMSDETHSRMTDYAVQLVRKDGIDMLWMSRVIGADPSGRPLFEIVDILKLPPRNKGELVAVFACCYGGRTNDAIVAYTDKYYYRVSKAWLANRKTSRIEEVSTRGIVCQDPATVMK
jgi:hypothetical protein